MDRTVTRGEVWLPEVGHKTRPVVVLTRSEVIDVRVLVTVTEITTQSRGIAADVGFDHGSAGLDHPSVVNCDGLNTIPRSTLSRHVGSLDDSALDDVYTAAGYALGC